MLALVFWCDTLYSSQCPLPVFAVNCRLRIFLQEKCCFVIPYRYTVRVQLVRKLVQLAIGLLLGMLKLCLRNAPFESAALRLH